MRHLIDYWYHFAIMFEALFILTTIDAGTRVARFLVREFLGRGYAPFARHDWMPGAAISTALVVAAWAYFIWAGSISTIWPMFGIANQLLASVALAVGTTVIINAGRARYAWVTLLPLAFVAVTTLTAGALSVRDNFYPMAIGRNPALHFQGYLNSIVTVVMMVCVLVILASAIMRWVAVLTGQVKPAPSTRLSGGKRLESRPRLGLSASCGDVQGLLDRRRDGVGHLAVAGGVGVQAVGGAGELVGIPGRGDGGAGVDVDDAGIGAAPGCGSSR